jgi:hypothetical protein
MGLKILEIIGYMDCLIELQPINIEHKNILVRVGLREYMAFAFFHQKK